MRIIDITTYSRSQIVGASTGQGPGGGDRSKPEEQPRAKQIAHALEPRDFHNGRSQNRA